MNWSFWMSHQKAPEFSPEVAITAPELVIGDLAVARHVEQGLLAEPQGHSSCSVRARRDPAAQDGTLDEHPGRPAPAARGPYAGPARTTRPETKP